MTIALLRPDKPGVYAITDIYDPNNSSGTGRIVPVPPSLVMEAGQAFTVVSVDPTTFASTLTPVYTQSEAPIGSVISYGNDVFRLYYDNRVTPNVLTIDSRCVVLGGDPAYYQIIRYPNTGDDTVISQYYGVSGNYIGPSPPMAAVGGISNSWSFPGCVTGASLSDNEELLVRVFNSEGSIVATITVHAKLASVVNASTDYRPRITALTLNGTQSTGDTSFFVYTRQSLASLFLSAQLTYDDGTTATIPIDNGQCFIYGTEDFVASYPGLVQKILVKYYLSPGELVTGGTNPLDGFISTEVTVTVVAHPTEFGGKISVIPIWNQSTAAYILRYFYYTLNRTAATDITAHVSLTGSTFSGSTYGIAQQFNLNVDLNAVDPVTYPTTTMYSQSFVITLQPIAALVRYIMRDSFSSVYVFGQDSSASRRPVLYYDSGLGQYYFPASIFQTLAAFLFSFYTQANPPYNVNIEEAPPTPTHFLLRDPTSGAMIVPAIIPVANYAAAFNIIGAGGSYVGNTVIVEFIIQVGGQNLILIGVPCDTYARVFGT